MYMLVNRTRRYGKVSETSVTHSRRWLVSIGAWVGLLLAVIWFIIHTGVWVSGRLYFGLAEALRRQLRRYLRRFRPRNGFAPAMAATTRLPRYRLIVDTR